MYICVFFFVIAGDNDKETSSVEIMATAATTTTTSVTETETEEHHEDDNKIENDNNDDDEADVVESSSSKSVSKLLLTTSSGLNNNTNKVNTSSSKSVKKPNLDKVVEKINHNNKKEITSISSCNSVNKNNNNNNSRKNFKMSDLIGSDEKDVGLNGNHSDPEMADEEDEGKSEEAEDHESASSQAQHNATAALAAAQQLMGANPAMFNPAMFPTGQAFQNVVAQFTANAVANNMDMDNVALLKSALFTLQQQQFLQFQLIQHLHSQLLRNNGGGGERGDENTDAERSETESEILAKRDEDSVAARKSSSVNKSLPMQYDSPLKRLEEQSARQELDLR